MPPGITLITFHVEVMAMPTQLSGLDPIERLRAGEQITDAEFDRVFPDWAHPPSRQHWTPVGVARRAARLLTQQPGARVLDVGSGVGKFCLVGSLTTAGVFVGIEQRPHFIEAARRAATLCGADRCTFLLGNMVDLDWAQFDAIYLYNPFAENRMAYPIDHTVQRSMRRYKRYVRFVEAKLAEVRAGTLLATYHGFGGTPPAGWKQLRNEAAGSGRIELWRKLSA